MIDWRKNNKHELLETRVESVEVEEEAVEESEEESGMTEEVTVIQVFQIKVLCRHVFKVEEEKSSPSDERLMKERRAATQEKIGSMVVCRWCGDQVQ